MFDRPSVLALSIRHVLEAEERITRLRAIIHKLTQGGHDTRLSQDLLATMCASLDLMKSHRDALQRKRLPDTGASSTHRLRAGRASPSPDHHVPTGQTIDRGRVRPLRRTSWLREG